MNRNYLLIILLFFSFKGLSQTVDKFKYNPEVPLIERAVTTDSMKVIIRSFTGGELLNDILQFEGIQYLKVEFEGKKVIGKRFDIKAKEIWNGEIKEISTVYESPVLNENFFFNGDTSLLPIRVIAKHANDSILKVLFRFPKLGATKEYKAIDSDRYVLISAIDETKWDTYVNTPDGQNSPAMVNEGQIKTNEIFPLLVYTLPYEMNGNLWWGNVNVCGRNIDRWGKRFGIKHYVVFEMEFKE